MNHTHNHVDCPACAGAGKLDINGLGLLGFGEAADVFIEMKRGYVSQRTINDYLAYKKALCKFFGGMPLKTIHIGNIRAYQKERVGVCCTLRVNHELCFLTMLLKEAGLWDSIAVQYQPLPKPRRSKKRRALSPEEEQLLFTVASTRKRWQVAYCCALITANTTAGASELINLRIGDINLREGLIHIVEGTKNEEGRVREIPLNDAALWAVEQLVSRYHKLCNKWGVDPSTDHYLLPHRAEQRNTKPDFKRPMFSWKTAWMNLRKAAGMSDLHYYSLRHHAITRLLECPTISEQVIEDIAGHLSHEMKRRYSHIRRAARKEAVNAINIALPKAMKTCAGGDD